MAYYLEMDLSDHHVWCVQDEQEAAYWDIFDEMTEDWETTLESKKEWLMPPAAMTPLQSHVAEHKSAKSAAAPSAPKAANEFPVEKEVIGNNSV